MRDLSILRGGTAILCKVEVLRCGLSHADGLKRVVLRLRSNGTMSLYQGDKQLLQ
jgi:hypothetical protein